jgi:hypothetical protein
MWKWNWRNELILLREMALWEVVLGNFGMVGGGGGGGTRWGG